MFAVEFQAKVTDGKIEIPEALRQTFSGDVNVIVFTVDAGDVSTWPERNRRRWELIAKKARQELTTSETEELATLQQRADAELARVGTRPVEHLERLYAALTERS